MKILHLSGEPEDVGGVLTVIRNLQAASEPWGWQHTVCVNRAYVELRRPSLRYWRSEHVYSDLPEHLPLLLRSLRTFFELRAWLEQESYNVLHAHSRGTFFVGLAAALFLRRPVLFTIHTYSRRVRMYRWGSRCPNFHTVVLTPQMLRHYGFMENPPKVNVISACCADSFFREPLASPKPRTASRPVHLVGVGNIMRWKNWRLVLEALTLLTSEERQRMVFSLWGPVPIDADSQAYGRELREFIRDRGLDKQCLLRGNTHSVADCLREADWFVLPSTNEPCSVALTEALALGVPALISASGGNLDILQPGKTGVLFRPDDAADLAAKLRLILSGSVAVLSPNEIRETVRHRSASAVAAQYRPLYLRLAEMTKATSR